MYNTILVPLDGSSLAEAALPHAEGLARLCGAAIIFLHVIELPHMVELPHGESFDALPHRTAAEVERQAEEARRYLDALNQRMRAAGIDAYAHVEVGPVVATIMHLARREQADLIALASHGRGGLTDVYYGSVAAGVLQRIDRPLLIVRAQ